MIAIDSFFRITTSLDTQITMYESGLVVIAVVVCINLLDKLGEVNGYHCDQNPCENGGTCAEYDPLNPFNESIHTTYYCTCLHCYRGNNCQIHVTDCDIQCYNGGDCILDNTCRQSCQCKACTIGSFCETVVSGCDDNLCHNGGRCQETGERCDDFECICPSCYLGRDCRVVDEECLRNFIPTIDPNQTVTNETTTLAAMDGGWSPSKESVLSSIIVILIIALVLVIILSLSAVCWMYRKYKINANLVEKQKLKILKMALSRDQMVLELSHGSGAEYEYSGVIEEETSVGGNLQSKPPEAKIKKNNNAVVKYNSSPPKVVIIENSDENKPIMREENHVRQNSRTEKGIENPLVVRHEEEIQAEINLSREGNRSANDFTEIDLNEDGNHSVHDFTEPTERKRRRRRTLSPVTSFSTDFANLLSCFRSGE